MLSNCLQMFCVCVDRSLAKQLIDEIEVSKEGGQVQIYLKHSANVRNIHCSSRSMHSIPTGRSYS